MDNNIPGDKCIINIDGTVDVSTDVDISGRNLERIPIKFGIVWGKFLCHGNKLKSLAGAPDKATVLFCQNNALTTLNDIVIECNLMLCHNNPITSYKDVIKHIKSIHGVMLPNNNIPILQWFLIDSLKEIEVEHNTVVNEILKRHIISKDILACQDELIDSGFTDWARL